MNYIKPILFSVLISLAAGCSKSWDEKHLDINGADSYQANLALDYSINGIMFFLDVGNPESNTFNIRLGALSEVGNEKLITIHGAETKSSEETQYKQITQSTFPLHLELKPEDEKKSICRHEFEKLDTPRFERNEHLTIKFNIEVEGEKKELVYELTPVIRTFHENDLPHNK